MGREGDLALQPLWEALTTRVPLTHHVLFPSFVALGTFYASCALFSAWDALQARPGLGKVLRECAWPQIRAHAVANAVGWVLVGGAAATRALPAEAPTVARLGAEVAASFVVGDFLIYWEHVAMHRVAWLRNRVHATHHEYTTPMYAWCAGWVHPIEIAVALACEAAFPVAYGVHPLSLWFFVATWTICLVEEHSGQHFRWSLYEWMPLGIGGGSKPHEIHHAPFLTKNFSFIFAVWDHLFGTFEDPDAHWAKKRRGGVESVDGGAAAGSRGDGDEAKARVGSRAD